MPNVTEEFLDLQGLQDYDYAIKNHINTGLNDKVDKVSGKGLSTEDYTTAEKNKLAGIASNADNVSWTQTVATGTKIAEITINGVTQNVYVPSLPQAESEVV